MNVETYEYLYRSTTLRVVIIAPTCEPTQMIPHDVANDSLVSHCLRAFQRRADRLQTQRGWSTATLNVLIEAPSGATWTPRGHRVAMAAALILRCCWCSRCCQQLLLREPSTASVSAMAVLAQTTQMRHRSRVLGSGGVSLACAARCHCERLRPSGKVPRMADRSDDVW